MEDFLGWVNDPSSQLNFDDSFSFIPDLPLQVPDEQSAAQQFAAVQLLASQQSQNQAHQVPNLALANAVPQVHVDSTHGGSVMPSFSLPTPTNEQNQAADMSSTVVTAHTDTTTPTTSTHQHSPPQTPRSIQPTAGSSHRSPPSPRVTGSRVTKPRDMQAKLRRRLNCCTQQQLVELAIEMVRKSVLPEKTLLEYTPKVDMAHLRQRCESLKGAIFLMMPDVPGEDHRDTNSYRRCKKAVLEFKNQVVNMAKTLADSAMWIDLIRYCSIAHDINRETPTWTDAANNKSRGAVETRLKAFVNRAVSALIKGKGCSMTVVQCTELIELCTAAFPDATNDLAAWVKRNTSSTFAQHGSIAVTTSPTTTSPETAT